MKKFFLILFAIVCAIALVVTDIDGSDLSQFYGTLTMILVVSILGFLYWEDLINKLK